jgi:amino acid permease
VLLGYLIVGSLVYFCLQQLLKVAEKTKFDEFEYEKLVKEVVGKKTGIIVEFMMIAAQIGIFTATVLFSGLLNSRILPV